MEALSRLEVLKGDITKLAVDAIVNAANTSLLGGSGVDGAIHRAAGPELAQECRLLGRCKPGQAKITKGYKLPAKHVIHTVGPIWRGGGYNESELLASCYRESLSLTVKHNIKTIAFPAISCGIYHFPINRATEIAVSEVINFLQENPSLDKVTFVCFDKAVHEAYLAKFSVLDKN